MKDGLKASWLYFKRKMLDTRGTVDLTGIGQAVANIGSTKGGKAMKAILHFPKSQSSMIELKQKVATVHAEAVVAKVNSLALPQKNKELLFSEVTAEIAATVEKSTG